MLSQEEIIKKYPQLFRFGKWTSFECGDGWNTLIDCICYQLNAEYTSDVSSIEYLTAGTSIKNDKRISELTAKLSDDSRWPRICQIKEKFGTLRFYIDFTNEYYEGVISLGEDMSAHICEVCGSTSNAKTRGGGWLRTLCENCLEK